MKDLIIKMIRGCAVHELDDTIELSPTGLNRLAEEFASLIQKERDVKEERRNMLEDVVNELDLSADMIEKHGPLGTPPAELVRLVLQEKDRKIQMLEQGMKQIKPSDVPVIKRPIPQNPPRVDSPKG